MYIKPMKLRVFFKVIKIFLLISVIFNVNNVNAELKISITQGQVAPTPIAVTGFYNNTASVADVGQKISQVVSADLERCGLFKPIDSSAFVQDVASLQSSPRFADWRIINAQLLVALLKVMVNYVLNFICLMLSVVQKWKA
jgi:TolB protein